VNLQSSPQQLRMSSFSPGVVIGLPVCRADPDGNILQRTAELAMACPLKWERISTES